MTERTMVWRPEPLGLCPSLGHEVSHFTLFIFPFLICKMGLIMIHINTNAYIIIIPKILCRA